MSKHVNRATLVIGGCMIRPGSEVVEKCVWLSKKKSWLTPQGPTELNGTLDVQNPVIETWPFRLHLETFSDLTREELSEKMDKLKEQVLLTFDTLDGFKVELGIKDEDPKGPAPDMAGPKASA